MKFKAALIGAVTVLCAVVMFGQGGGGQNRGQGGQGQGRAEQTPATDKVTPEIAGVVKAGTKLEIVKAGLKGSDAGTGMPDGSVLVSSAGSILKIDAEGN